MSLRTTIETLIHLDKFKNINLNRQGVYRLRCRLFSRGHNKEFVSMPYSISSNKYVEEKTHVHKILDAAIDDLEHVFFSNAFYIQYKKEEVELQHFVQFRTELDMESEKSPLYLEVALMVKEIPASGGIKQVLSEFFSGKEETVKMKIVEKKVIRLSNVAQTVLSGCVPVEFGDLYCSQIGLTVHSVALDYKFRTAPLSARTPFSNQSEEEPVMKIETTGKESLQTSSKTPIPTLAEYFFADEEGNLPSRVNEDEFTEITHDYLPPLYSVLNKLKSKFFDLNQRVSSDLKFKLEKSFFSSLNTSIASMRISELDKENIDDKYEDKTPIKEKIVYKPEEAALKFVEDANEISGIILPLWFKYIELIKQFSPQLISILSKEYSRILTETFDYFFINSNQLDRFNNYCLNNAIRHSEHASKLRSSEFHRSLAELPAQDQTIFECVENIPILFEETYIIEGKPASTKISEGRHLYVFVHGFGASSHDMETIQNQWSIMFPDGIFLCANSNAGLTDLNILTLGENLAVEVRAFITKCPHKVSKIDFVGHSLGGVIIRAALPHLKMYREKMNTFVTFGSPHLGYLFSTSSLIDLGMWFIKKWQHSICMEQLSLKDNTCLQDCVMYKLSQFPGLDWFSNVLLINSHQDHYAPFESARIEMCEATAAPTTQGLSYSEMIINLSEKLKNANLYRVDVSFNINSTNMNNFIGRTAHILFLNNVILLKMLLQRYRSLFI